ncbi:MAG TPA: AraC family transcriptional regulator [Phnomibacter sp.]|nr:AraC family transcriptional regulator [Phnomibacter sp.]
MDTLWVRMPILKNIIWGASAHDEIVERICRQGGITMADLDKADMKLSLQQNCALMEAALQLSGDPHLGLHIGQRTTVSVLGMAGYLMQSSEDLLTALQLLQQFTASFSMLYTFRLEVKNEHALYYCEPVEVWNDVSPATARQSVDIAFAGALHILRLLSGRGIRPLKAMYRYARIGSTEEHERVLHCRPIFDQPCNAIVFSLTDLKQKIIGHDRVLNETFRQLLEQKMKSDKGSPLVRQVQTVILEKSRTAFPTIDEVAAQMHFTPRTLQRKLQDEGVSFRTLCDTIKKDIAISLLSLGKLSVSEIADRTGYTDATAFQRAFRLWTGESPGAYRQKAGPP